MRRRTWVVVGVVAAASGVVWLLMAPQPTDRRTAVVPYVWAGAAGVDLVHRF